MKTPFLLFALIPSFLSAKDALAFSRIFTDHMVLQRDQEIMIWGRADAGDALTLRFGGQSKTTRADDKGRWQVKLDPLTAFSTGQDLSASLSNSDETITLKNVVVGDVWLCSGQSNMHFQMKSTARAEEEIAGMDHPSIRFFTVKQQFGQQELEDVNGRWQTLTPSTAPECSAVACYFACALQPEIGVPVGLVISSVGGTRIESWMRPETLAATGESKDLIEKWRAVDAAEFEKIGQIYSAFQYERDRTHPEAVRKARAEGKPLPPPPVAPKQRCHDAPSALHHGMIAPIEDFRVRGFLWYQGESNSGRPAPYRKLLPAMIADWRKTWGETLPFLFVQIAPHQSIHPTFREAQHEIWQNTPHTGMAVTTDVGDLSNIHPTRKRPVGERLATAALAIAYGKDIEASGPLFKEMQIQDDRATLSFTHVGRGLVTKKEPLGGFTIAAADGRFFPAEATISGDQIIVRSDKVAQVAAVRYNWSKNPTGLLFNKDGLPAPPFRTDRPTTQK
ncbi:MAG: hypothetical protein MUF31_14840 [Akkermansiaceae bacterium]|jgi:sialate O-acetylesterase|nr:hypothetical protein [Akkermansiaceae bacterium]